eukprot:5776599-Pyramimonas_sp.AAC.1
MGVECILAVVGTGGPVIQSDTNVDVKGAKVDVKGADVDVKGGEVDAKGVEIPTPSGSNTQAPTHTPLGRRIRRGTVRNPEGVQRGSRGGPEGVRRGDLSVKSRRP